MPARDVFKNYQLFIDGRGYAGQIEEFKPPELSTLTEEWRGGGMDGPVSLDMGMEALETTFSMISFDKDVLALWGLREGQEPALTVRAALESADGTVTPIAWFLRGKVSKNAPGALKPGEKVLLEFTVKPYYYRYEHGGAPLIEVDFPNMIRKINGVDQLAAIRKAIGK